VPATDPTLVARRSRRRALLERARRTELQPARPTIVVAWVAMAAVGVALLAFSLNSRDADRNASTEATLPGIAPTVPVTTATAVQPPPPTAPPVVASTTIAVSATTTPVTVAATAAPTIVAPATTPLATAPATSVPAPATSVAPDPAPGAPVPTVPASTPESGPGSPQVLNDPLPSGVSAQAVAPAFAVAQRLADALAGGQWDNVRAIDVDGRGASDQALEVGYGGLDRASLMLLDATPTADGYRLLVVSVANELGGEQTSLYCLEWSADPDAATVDQHGGSVGLVERVPEVLSPEAVRNDPALDEAVRSECHWRSAER
jgi:hypothetical protein